MAGLDRARDACGDDRNGIPGSVMSFAFTGRGKLLRLNEDIREDGLRETWTG